MALLLDFGALPPEINSGRMYSGPGSAPMLTAATTWNTLAAELRSQAASYGSVISGLTSDGWRGPASTSMAAAAAPYAAWMNTTAAQAERTAAQATAAVGAYETAFAMTVPPPVIAANRAQLMSLIATNILGQNTPAIAATEAHYGEMWAQDAAAMYGYAGSSAAATQLTPFTAPAPTTNPGGMAAQAAAVTQAAGTPAGTTQSTLSQLTSAVPTALQGLASPASSTSSSGLGNLLSGLDPSTTGLGSPWDFLNSTFAGTATSAGTNGMLSVGQTGSFLTSFSSLAQAANGTAGGAAGAAGDAAGAAADAAGAAGDAAGAAGQAASGAVGDLGGLGGAVSAGVGEGASIGPLSVPPSWVAAAPAISPLASALGGTPLSAPPAGMPGMAGIPFLGAAAGNGLNGSAPKYGFRPIVVAHPPAAG